MNTIDSSAPENKLSPNDADELHRRLVAAIASAGEERLLGTGDIVCREGDESDGAFIVVAGSLDAHVEGHDATVCVATHGPGSIAGEITTLIGGHRTATLTAAEPTTISVTSRDALRLVFDEHPVAAAAVLRAARERTDRSRVAVLLSRELEAPDGAAVAAIAERVTWLSVAAGDTLFNRGDPADAAYLVVSGRLGITDFGLHPTPQSTASTETAPHRSSRDGHVEEMIEVGRGGVVGEFGLLEDRARSATVVALRDCSLARLSAEDFRGLAVSHTALAMGLVRRILDRSGRDHSSPSTARTFTVAVTADIEKPVIDAMVAAMHVALDACGRTTVLDPVGIDRDLNQTGISNTASGSFGEVRLAELLHQTETDADHVMLLATSSSPDDDEETPDGLTNWTQRALHHADQVVVICSPRPGGDESARIQRVLDATPGRIPRWLALHHPPATERPPETRLTRERFAVDDVLHLRGTSELDLARLARLAAGRGVGLVLSGGGARGHAHIGVYRALCELGVPVDRVVGASMGSIVAGAIGQDLSPERLLDEMKHGAGDLLDYTVPIVSMIKGERIVEVLEHHFDGWEIDDLWIPFSCVSTNLTTAEVELHSSGSVATAIRTSVSIPGVLPPVVRGDHLLADGGVLDNLPVGVFADDPSIGTIIASDVAPPLGPTAKGDYGLSVSGWTAMRTKMGPKRFRTQVVNNARYPGIGATLMRAMLIGSSKSRDDHLDSGVVDLYLDLDLRGIGLLDFGQVEPAAVRGYESSRGRIADWLTSRGGAPWGDPVEMSTVAQADDRATSTSGAEVSG